MSEDFFEIGYFAKIHGFKGNLQFKSTADDPMKYGQLDALFVQMPMGQVPFVVEHMSHKRGNEFIVKLEGVDTDVDAKNLTGKAVMLPSSLLPVMEADDEFYHHEIEGFDVIVNQKSLGKILSVLDIPGNPQLEIELKSGDEAMVPMHDDFIKSINKKAKEIHLELPEGLLDLNLEAK